jgi:hypothetical protein
VHHPNSLIAAVGKKTFLLLQSVSARLHHQVHHPSSLTATARKKTLLLLQSVTAWLHHQMHHPSLLTATAGKKTLLLLQSVSAGLHHQVHHPTTLVHVVCLYHLLSCLRTRVSVFFRNRIENYNRNGPKGNRYTCNMQEMEKHVTAGIGILTVLLVVFLDHLFFFVRACTCVCSLCE